MSEREERRDSEPGWAETGLTRRRVLGASAAGVAALALPAWLAACGDDDEDSGGSGEDLGDSVVYGFFGGDFGASQKEVMFDTFAAETGVRVSTPATDFSRFRLMAERGNAQWDATDADSFIAGEWIEEGLVSEFPSDVKRCDLLPKEYQDYLGGAYFFSYVQGYKKETYPDGGPQDWADFWDTKKFPGKRGLPKSGFFAGVLEAALMADGVDKDSLYPVDIDRALAKLDEIRGDTLFFDSYGTGAQLLAQDSVAIVFDPVSRIVDVGNKTSPTEIVWNQAFLTYSASPVIKDPPHPEAAFALMDWMADPKRQAQLAELTYNAPAVEEGLEYIPDDLLPNLCNSDEHKEMAATVDDAALVKQYREIQDRYAEWLAS